MNEDKLVIIEKCEEFINYIYPILQNIQRKHGILKEKIIQTIFLQPELFYKAIKSDSKRAGAFTSASVNGIK